MNQAIQEAANKLHIPLYDEVDNLDGPRDRNALEQFIYDNEPAPPYDQAFREEITAVCKQMFIAGAEWAELKWIPVTQHLPEEKGMYFVHGKKAWHYIYRHERRADYVCR